MEVDVDTDRTQLEEEIFIELIEDILQSTPGLNYQLHISDPATSDEDSRTYAVFMIETNPEYELEVSIILKADHFLLRVNDEEFTHTIGNRRRIDRWIESRCRNVEQLVKGDLKLEVETIFGLYLSSGLYAGSDDHWIEIADRDEGWGWIGLIVWILPFGLSPLKSQEIEYRGWFDVPGKSDSPNR